jgi:hypothetical protein
MKFVLRVRSVEVGDMNRSVQSVPDEDEHSMYLDALGEEIGSNQIIATVVRTESAFELTTSSSISEKELSALLKPHFAGDLFDKLRCVSLEEA